MACQNCDFFRVTEDNWPSGVCMMNPPQWVSAPGVDGWHRPPVREDDFCAAWQGRATAWGQKHD